MTVASTHPIGNAELKNSGIGVASFVLSLVAGIGFFIVFMIAGYVEVTTPGGMDEESAEAVIIGLLIIGMLLLQLVSLGLGIGGLLQKDCKRTLAVLGTVFSGGAIVCILGVIVLGMAIGA